MDAAGLGLAPLPALALAAVAAGILVWRWRPAAHPAIADVLVWTAVVLFVLTAIVRLAWPALLPPGRGPDLTHHLLLVDYIEQQRHLVHDRSLDGSMGEMAHYTPGAHLLAVSIGALDRQSMACARSFRCWCSDHRADRGLCLSDRAAPPPADSVRDRRGDPAVPALTVFLRRLHARRVPCASTGDVLRGGLPVGAHELGRATVRKRRRVHRAALGRHLSHVADPDWTAGARVRGARTSVRTGPRVTV